MMFYLFLVLLPCILAGNETHIDCPDESYCPIRETTCCNNDSTNYFCCDIQEEDKQNKKLNPVSSKPDFKKDLDEEIKGNCSGTPCVNNKWCCKYEKAACCLNTTSCCPADFKCCGLEPPEVWCCKTNERCAKTFLYCIAGANSISSTFLSMIIMLVIAVSLKHF